MNVERSTWIEELVRARPGAVAFLRERGIRCLACGEPIWGSVEEAAREKGLTESQIDELVRDLNELDAAG